MSPHIRQSSPSAWLDEWKEVHARNSRTGDGVAPVTSWPDRCCGTLTAVPYPEAAGATACLRNPRCFHELIHPRLSLPPKINSSLAHTMLFHLQLNFNHTIKQKSIKTCDPIDEPSRTAPPRPHAHFHQTNMISSLTAIQRQPRVFQLDIGLPLGKKREPTPNNAAHMEACWRPSLLLKAWFDFRWRKNALVPYFQVHHCRAVIQRV